MAGLTPKPVREFTRAAPCTKVHLFNCFRSPDGKGYIPRAVIEARGEIGINAIKYLKKEGYAHEYGMRGVDYWELTGEGIAWLVKGLRREIELHPGRAADINKPMPAVQGATRRITRRTY